MHVLPTLTTPRLRLRKIRASDAADLLVVFSDPEVVRYWSSPPLSGLAAADAMIDRMEAMATSGERLQWAIVRDEQDRLIGTSTLADIDLDHQRASIGYALARGAWGQGFAREAVRATVEFAFTTLGLHRLGAECDPRNDRSLLLLKDLGFVREGLQRECYFVVNEWQDSVILGLLDRDWLGEGPGEVDVETSDEPDDG